MESFLLSAFVFLVAAIMVVPIAGKLGFGSVLGYLAAGMAIGPYLLGFIDNPEGIMHSAEFGVVMMLFLIGLELQPAKLWRLRRSVIGLGGMQVGCTLVSITLICILGGLEWTTSLAIGAALALSSTAIALQTLNERHLMNTPGGRRSFAILLFQDIAVIPMLALLPLLATTAVVAHAPTGEAAEHASMVLTEGLPGWQQALITIAAITVIILFGRFFVRPAFRYIASSGAREIFTAFALAIVIGIALLMHVIGLSPALGAFIAGVVLAESEYRHELETNIEPFKGLLMGLFFIAVGASINFQIIAANPGLVFGSVIGLVVLKFIILQIVAYLAGLHGSQRWLVALILAQGGEFAFVLFDLAFQTNIINKETTQILMVIVAISMAITPFLMMYYQQVVQPKYQNSAPQPSTDTNNSSAAVHEAPAVIIAGFGRFGQMVGRVLYSQRIKATVLDHDPNQINLLRKFGFDVLYGDATRLDLLESAGAATATTLVIAIDDVEQSIALANLAKKHFPHLNLIARARNRVHAYQLINMGVNTFEREVFTASMNVATHTLQSLGYRAYQAQRIVRKFAVHDRDTLIESAGFYEDEARLINHTTEARDQLEMVFEQDNEDLDHSDKGWG